jgi:hypothetical protein
MNEPRLDWDRAYSERFGPAALQDCIMVPSMQHPPTHPPTQTRFVAFLLNGNHQAPFCGQLGPPRIILVANQVQVHVPKIVKASQIMNNHFCQVQ